MADAECPICIISFNLEKMRSLYCGHTYCTSCIQQLIDTDTLKCPECRQDFDPGDVRRLYITPSSANDRSVVHATPDSAEDGFIKQATHIANRLKRMNSDTPAQSLKIAVDIMEDVATIQSERAQEILWKAVREFWITLVPLYEEWQRNRGLPAQVSDLKQRAMELDQRCSSLDQRCSALELAAENRDKQMQQHAENMEDKEQEIAQLQMTLREVNERNTEERERHRVLLARHRASETKYRAQVKQLKKEVKSRERESLTSKSQLEEESLVVEPGIPYDEARSHRLDIYNGAEGSHQHHHRKRTPARARNSDDAEELESLSSCPSSTQPASETQERGRGKAKRPHKSVESSSSPSLRRPQFGSDWDLARLRPRKQAEPGPLPLQLDSRGKPKGLLQCGPRVRIKTKHP